MDPSDQNSAELPRFSKGKRPQFFVAEGMDEAMSMITVLASELSAMRDRVETLELLLTKGGSLDDGAINAFKPDGGILAARDQRRQELLDRMYYLTLKKAHEQEGGETEQGYVDTLSEIAKP